LRALEAIEGEHELRGRRNAIIALAAAGCMVLAFAARGSVAGAPRATPV
jgi:hypothetical protein